MEKITKITRTTEITEYITVCSECKKQINGSTESQVRYNLNTHKRAKHE